MPRCRASCESIRSIVCKVCFISPLGPPHPDQPFPFCGPRDKKDLPSRGSPREGRSLAHKDRQGNQTGEWPVRITFRDAPGLIRQPGGPDSPVACRGQAPRVLDPWLCVLPFRRVCLYRVANDLLKVRGRAFTSARAAAGSIGSITTSVPGVASFDLARGRMLPRGPSNVSRAMFDITDRETTHFAQILRTGGSDR